VPKQLREASEIEKEIQARFNPDNTRRFTSTAVEAAESTYVKDLALPAEKRGTLPMTRDAYAVNENPARVEWEREVRKFLARLNSDFGHRITAPMIYEWTTGISIKDLVKAEGVDESEYRGGAQNGSANSHLRHINAILKEYFGTPYKTTIAGRPVGRAYTVRRHFKVSRKRPVSITLLPEWEEGTLDDRAKRTPKS
jgi:hypothetical protein